MLSLFFSSILLFSVKGLLLEQIEGVYKVNTTYRTLDGSREVSIDRLVIAKVTKDEKFAASLGSFNSDWPLIYTTDVKVDLDAGKKNFILKGEGYASNGLYGETLIKISLDGSVVSGYFTDGVAVGYKEFEGRRFETFFEPDISDSTPCPDGVYVGEYKEGDKSFPSSLFLRTYSSGTKSALSSELQSTSGCEKAALAQLKDKTKMMEISLIGYSVVLPSKCSSCDSA